MIKGLFFKLNIDSPGDSVIWNFFTETPAKEKCTKKELLYKLILIYEHLPSGIAEDLETE